MDSDHKNDWLCAACNAALEQGKIQVAYMGSEFAVDLLRCPKCGIVLIPEELATGRMAEAEKILEDK
jgi:hypothetical protein